MPSAQRGELERHKELLQRMQAHLEAGKGLRSMTFTEIENKELRAYQLITRLPMLLIVNIGEDDLARAAEIEAEFRAKYSEPGIAVAALCAKIEAELSQMEPADAEAFRADLGLPPESPLDRAIVAAYELLGLQSFLTAGDDECRAWTVPVGATAPQAAGRIHSDLEKGFIRAEVSTWQDVVAAKGSSAELKKTGKLRTEGKGYIVQDGDVINILVNL